MPSLPLQWLCYAKMGRFLDLVNSAVYVFSLIPE